MFTVGETVVIRDTPELREDGIANCEAVVVDAPSLNRFIVRMAPIDGSDPDPRNDFEVFAYELRAL